MDSFSFSSSGAKTKTIPSPDRHPPPESGTDHSLVLSHGRSVDKHRNTPSSNPSTQDQKSPRKQVLERETRAHTPTSRSDTATAETNSSQPNSPSTTRSNAATTTNNSGLTRGRIKESDLSQPGAYTKLSEFQLHILHGNLKNKCFFDDKRQVIACLPNSEDCYVPARRIWEIKAGGANEAHPYYSEHKAQYKIWAATGEKNTESSPPQPFSQSNNRPGSTTVLTSKPTRSPDTPSTEQPSRSALASATCKPKFSDTSPSRHLSHKPNSPTGQTLEPIEKMATRLGAPPEKIAIVLRISETPAEFINNYGLLCKTQPNRVVIQEVEKYFANAKAASMHVESVVEQLIPPKLKNPILLHTLSLLLRAQTTIKDCHQHYKTLCFLVGLDEGIPLNITGFGVARKVIMERAELIESITDDQLRDNQAHLKNLLVAAERPCIEETENQSGHGDETDELERRKLAMRTTQKELEALRSLLADRQTSSSAELIQRKREVQAQASAQLPESIQNWLTEPEAEVKRLRVCIKSKEQELKEKTGWHDDLAKKIGQELARDVSRDTTKVENISTKTRPSVLQEKYSQLTFQTASTVKGAHLRGSAHTRNEAIMEVYKFCYDQFKIGNPAYQEFTACVLREAIGKTNASTVLGYHNLAEICRNPRAFGLRPPHLPTPLQVTTIHETAPMQALKGLMVSNLDEHSSNTKILGKYREKCVASVNAIFKKDAPQGVLTSDSHGFIEEVLLLCAGMQAQQPPMELEFNLPQEAITNPTTFVEMADTEGKYKLLPFRGMHDKTVKAFAFQYLEPTLKHRETVLEQGRIQCIPITNDHFRSLQMHVERGEVFFNDDLKALTSLDERYYFSPNNDGGFSTRPAREQLPGYDDIKSQYHRWEKAPVASAQTSRSKPSFTAKQPQLAYSTTPANKGKLATFNSTWTSEQPHRNTEKRPTLEAVVGPRPSSSKAVVKAMSPMPKTTAGQTEVAKREQQQPVVIRHYFSGYKGSYDSFKKEHKELCDFMRTRDVLGKANYPDHCKSIFEHRGFFEHHLYQMFMVETSRAALSPLMARFRSADDLQTKNNIAIEIAEQCIQRSNDTSSHLLANKDSYYEACDPTKTNKEDSPSTVAVADTSAAQFFKEAVRILRGHQSDAAEVRRFLDQNYDTPDFAFKFDMKKAESDGRYRREGGPAEAKEKLLSGFQALIKSGKVIDIESGSLKVPAAVAANPEDMACYKTYAQQMFSLHKKVEASLATQDSASFKDADFLLNICQVALQTMELNDQCAKKQLASQTEKPALH